jgi:hypothetical protein
MTETESMAWIRAGRERVGNAGVSNHGLHGLSRMTEPEFDVFIRVGREIRG